MLSTFSLPPLIFIPDENESSVFNCVRHFSSVYYRDGELKRCCYEYADAQMLCHSRKNLTLSHFLHGHCYLQLQQWSQQFVCLSVYHLKKFYFHLYFYYYYLYYYAGGIDSEEILA